MAERAILISGLGIAGPTLAHWLGRYCISTTVVERAPALRREGYLIDFWGAGYDVADKMGLIPAITSAGYHVREVRLVDRRGRRTGGFDADVFRAATGGRFTSVPRGELSAILARSLDDRTEVLFGDSITALERSGDGVRAHFERAGARRFDLVVGADGLHSRVRELVFGPEPKFERFLGYTVAAFAVSRYGPHDEDVYLVYSEPGRQLMRFSMRDDRTMFLIVLVADGTEPELHDPAEHQAYIERRCRGMGWEWPQIRDALARCDDLYFDRVSQIHVPRWSMGPIALVGDAAFAPSLLAGQGAALGMIGAYILAGALARRGSPEDAFDRYERRLRAFLEDKQAAAARFAHSFAPRTRFGIFLRNLVTRALVAPSIAKAVFGATLLDRIELPEPAAPDHEPRGPAGEGSGEGPRISPRR